MNYLIERQIVDVLHMNTSNFVFNSNAIKFTHEGKVGIKLYVVAEPPNAIKQGSDQTISSDQSKVLANMKKEEKCLLVSQSMGDQIGTHRPKDGEDTCGSDTHKNEPSGPERNGITMEEDKESNLNTQETIVWICCDVYDTGIGIPENAIPTLFKKYMQVGVDTARKYGGTGLGLAICKQLVELIGGYLTVSSKEHFGSTFTFVLPYKVSPVCDNSDDPDEMSDMANHDVSDDANDEDLHSGIFLFPPRTLGSLFSSLVPGRTQKFSQPGYGSNASIKFSGLSDSYSLPSYNITSKENISVEDARSIGGSIERLYEAKTSLRHSSDSDNLSTTAKHEQYPGRRYDHFNPYTQSTNSFTGETSDSIGSQEVTCNTQTQSNGSSECSSSNTPEIPKPELKAKILLVEDNKINVMVTKSMMKQLGHSIDVVNNGAEAVRAVQRNSYDLILMDVCMPIMNGLQATKLIRSFEETGSWNDAVKAGIELGLPPADSKPNSRELTNYRKRIPIIAMTANALSESADECFANGMDSFVSKPVTFQNLKQCLNQYLS